MVQKLEYEDLAGPDRRAPEALVHALVPAVESARAMGGLNRIPEAVDGKIIQGALASPGV